MMESVFMERALLVLAIYTRAGQLTTRRPEIGLGRELCGRRGRLNCPREATCTAVRCFLGRAVFVRSGAEVLPPAGLLVVTKGRLWVVWVARDLGPLGVDAGVVWMTVVEVELVAARATVGVHDGRRKR